MKTQNKKTGPTRWLKTERGYTAIVRTAYGKRHIPTGTHDKRLAIRFARRAKLEEREAVRFERKAIAAFTSVHSRLTFTQALEEWVENLSTKRSPVTVENYEYIVSQWLKRCKLSRELPSAATEADVGAFVNDHTSVKAGTRRVRLSVLASFFTWLQARGYAIGNPARAVGDIDMRRLSFEQKEPKRKIPFTLDEIARILAYCDERIAYEYRQYEEVKRCGVRTGYDHLKRIDSLRFWKAATVIGRHTGLRLSDVSKLEWASVTNSGLVVWTRKRDARVSLPMCEELRAVLEEFKPQPVEPRQYVFPEQHLTASSELSGQFAKLLRGCGISGKSHHCLRSTCALDIRDRLIAAGKSEPEAVEIVAKLLGHQNSSTTVNHYLPPEAHVK